MDEPKPRLKDLPRDFSEGAKQTFHSKTVIHLLILATALMGILFVIAIGLALHVLRFERP